MLWPNDKGFFRCENEGCGFDSNDIFDFLDHSGVEFTWGVKITPKYSFDLFEFLQYLSDTVNHGDIEDAYLIIQETALAFVNASSNELEAHIEESIVADEASAGIKHIERLLRDNQQG
jgi:hypothetical protein